MKEARGLTGELHLASFQSSAVSRLDLYQYLLLIFDMTGDEYETRSTNGQLLIALGGVIHDISSFIDEHPGGRALITSSCGKDATARFNGGIYQHSNAAHNLLSTMRIGVLQGGCEVEVLKTGRGKIRT
jgi:cytochrome b involved in lipid metabolism